MNKITVFLLVIIMALSFLLGASMQSKAENKTYTGIMPFVTSNDRIGFVDQNNGRIYIYDSNISKCLFIGQIDTLGQSINTLASTPATTLNR